MYPRACCLDRGAREARSDLRTSLHPPLLAESSRRGGRVYTPSSKKRRKEGATKFGKMRENGLLHSIQRRDLLLLDDGHDAPRLGLELPLLLFHGQALRRPLLVRQRQGVTRCHKFLELLPGDGLELM